ncbi:MAG: diacylglycerol/lipid kinase family protein [Chitinophagaceae bacterium]
MKNIALLHNPNAGDEAHSKEKLIHQIEEEGYNCRYSSTKEKGWDKLKDDTDLIVMAGGDGTIRKVMLKFFANEKTDIPFTLLPLGTANNIARTFNIKGKTIDIIKSWRNGKVSKVDIGKYNGGGLFLESYGAGLFPLLMKTMKRRTDEAPAPEEELLKALELFHATVLSAEAVPYKLIVDGEDRSGKYLMVEIMNMRSIGPNLLMAPHADTGDGKFEVIAVGENERTLLAEHIRRKMSDPTDAFPFQPIVAENVEMSWNGKNGHADDSFTTPEADKIIRIRPAKEKVKLLLGTVKEE